MRASLTVPLPSRGGRRRSPRAQDTPPNRAACPGGCDLSRRDRRRVVKRRPMGVKSGRVVGIDVHAETDQDGQGARIAVEGRGRERFLPLAGARRRGEASDVVGPSQANGRRQAESRAALQEPLGRGDFAMREGRLESAVQVRAGVGEQVDELALDAALPHDPSGADEPERVVDLLLTALHALGRVQDDASHRDDVGRQSAVADRVLRHEPEQVRPAEVPLALIGTVAGEPGVVREKT